MSPKVCLPLSFVFTMWAWDFLSLMDCFHVCQKHRFSYCNIVTFFTPMFDTSVKIFDMIL